MQKKVYYLLTPPVHMWYTYDKHIRTCTYVAIVRSHSECHYHLRLMHMHHHTYGHAPCCSTCKTVYMGNKFPTPVSLVPNKYIVSCCYYYEYTLDCNEQLVNNDNDCSWILLHKGGTHRDPILTSHLETLDALACHAYSKIMEDNNGS